MAVIEATVHWKALRLGYYNGTSFVTVNAEPAGWKDAGFDDSAWDPVGTFTRVEHDVPFIYRTADASTRGDEVLYRCEFYLTAADLMGADAVFQYAFDNGGEVYVNGVTEATLGTPYTVNGTYITDDHETTIARSEFVEGWNAVGMYCWNDRSGSDGASPPGPTAAAVRIAMPVSSPGGTLVEWDGITFESERIKEWTISRGASPELTGGTNPGQATIILVNTPDDRYNPENTGGDLHGLLHDGPRVWIGVNDDGTIAPSPDKAVHGLFAGNITDLSVLPEPGAAVAPFVEIVCADPLEWAGRQRVRVVDSLTRSQYDLRVAVLDELGVVGRDLGVEPATLPLSGVDGAALDALDEINKANGTRHFAKPADNAVDWYTYTTIRRTSRLDGTSEADLDAGADHVTGTSGWRISADGVINQQKATVVPMELSALRDVWEAAELPMTVTGEVEVFTDFDDFVSDPLVDVAYSGSALTTSIEPFGSSAKVTLTSAGTSVLSHFSVQGYIAKRGIGVSFEANDTTSQATTRGVRAGSELTGDVLGTLTSAQGFAEHIVWRFGSHLYRPTLTVVNWIPEMFELDLFDRISLTVAELSIEDRIFEIVGLTHHGVHAAADDDGNPTAVFHEVTYVLQESRVQEPYGWFILDSSLLDGDDVLAY